MEYRMLSMLLRVVRKIWRKRYFIKRNFKWGVLIAIAVFLFAGDDSLETKLQKAKQTVYDVAQDLHIVKEKAELTLSETNYLKDMYQRLANDEEVLLTTDPTGSGTITYRDVAYTIYEVDGGDTSGERFPNAAVDIGFGERVYWGLTNEYGQLVFVIADQIILQDDSTEPTKNGRYYSEEAFVPGVEAGDLDQGHVIADSLGGVSNAYNITPQNDILNRYGDQAYLEKHIRDVGGCTDFVAEIWYQDTNTQIPSMYHIEYKVNGELFVSEFENKNPEEEE